MNKDKRNNTPLCRESAPYHFVPIDPTLAITDAPVYHDIQHDEASGFWSGEIQCEMTALTPTIVGHYRYNFDKLKNLQNKLNQLFGTSFDKNKTVLEPITLPGSDNRPGPVLIPGTSIKGMLRHSLSALLSAPIERADEEFCSQLTVEKKSGEYCLGPRGLSGARNFYGYCSQKDDKNHRVQTHGIGSGDFEQLSGRISVNWAIESDLTRENRFVKDDKDFLNFVPLKTLLSPKSSAVKRYLTQINLEQRNNGDFLRTHGDSPDAQSDGELYGRKFYLHQPEILTKPSCYNLSISQSPKAKDQLNAKLASLVRNISARGSKFRFTLRFRNLREWELGAILLALSPSPEMIRKLLDSFNKCSSVKKIKRFLENFEKHTHKETPFFAHKIGYGKPLGLGSVRIDLNCMKKLSFDENLNPNLVEIENINSVADSLTAAFAKKISESLGSKAGRWLKAVFLPWLQINRFVGRKLYDYPRVRRSHSGDRKQTKPLELKSLKELDEEELSFLD